LKAVARHSGWDIVAVYEDAGISGAKRRDQRPAYDQLLNDAARRQFDVAMAWSVDRLGRSLTDLVGFMDELNALGIDLYLHQQGIDTTTPSGRAMFQMCGVFAEFERAMIQERVKAGLNRARAQGKRLGRRPIPAGKIAKVMDARGEGLSIRKIAAKVGISPSAVHKVIKNAA
jgi:DNA invertase Pin-like site-specific DNA recombinase